MQKAASKNYKQTRTNLKRTVSFSKNATNVFFHILTQCNLKCRHCYINPKQQGKELVPLSTIKNWLQVFSKKKEAVNVIFLGGEPTLHPDLSSAIKKVRELGFGSVTVDTNGYLFNNILDRITPDEVEYFSFSLDGPDPETNDSIRGKGSFKRCVSGIRQAVSKGFHTSLIYTVSGANIHELYQMPPLLKNLGIERFFIQVIGIRGKSADSRPFQVEELQVPYEQWIDIVPKVAERSAETGIMVTYPKVYLNVDEHFECAGVVADNYFIFPNGRVYRCPLCEDYPVHSFQMENTRMVKTAKINETDLFHLTIPEGCVMNKIIQPHNIRYDDDGFPRYQVACCMLKEEVRPVMDDKKTYEK
jgi:MoaA/NifB/PqqE/SkfB family radical SAM enzyme